MMALFRRDRVGGIKGEVGGRKSQPSTEQAPRKRNDTSRLYHPDTGTDIS